MGSAEIDATQQVRNGKLTTKGRRTKASLLLAARAAFEELGYLDTRIVDIVSRADLGQGSFYTYWNSKEEAFSELVVGLHEALRGPRIDPDPDPVRSIHHANRRYVTTYRNNAKLMAAWEQVCSCDPDFTRLKTSFREASVHRVADFIGKLQRAGQADVHLDATCAAKALISMTNHAIYVAASLGEEDDEGIDRLTDQLDQTWIYALGLHQSHVGS